MLMEINPVTVSTWSSSTLNLRLAFDTADSARFNSAGVRTKIPNSCGERPFFDAPKSN